MNRRGQGQRKKNYWLEFQIFPPQIVRLSAYVVNLSTERKFNCFDLYIYEKLGICSASWTK